MKVYAAKHRDGEIVKFSQSGGMFTALSDSILENGGIVYGCALTADFTVAHIRAQSKEERDRMRGSKYVQSKLGDTFRNVKADLNNGLQVLFSGTPCQVLGLKKYLQKDYERLVCVDLVCHGVPSPDVWNSYLKWQKKRHRSEIESVRFRNKELYGWNSHVETIWYSNGKIENTGIFRDLFYKHLILRPSCYECRFKNIQRPGDITIADYWGIENVIPQMYDNNGVSLVLVNSTKGEALFEQIKDMLIFQSTTIQEAMQPCLKAAFPKPERRDQFWSDYYKKSFSYIAKKYTEYGEQVSILAKIKRKKMKLVSFFYSIFKVGEDG